MRQVQSSRVVFMRAKSITYLFIYLELAMCVLIVFNEHTKHTLTHKHTHTHTYIHTHIWIEIHSL